MSFEKTMFFGPDPLPITKLFEDFKFCKEVYVPGDGTKGDNPPGYYFISGIRSRGEDSPCSYKRIGRDSFFLYGKPTEKMLDAAEKLLLVTGLGCFEVVIRDNGTAGVFGQGNQMIGTAWLAFISTDEIPGGLDTEIYLK